MCEPISLTTAIGLGISAAGAVTGVVGAIQQGNAAKSQADYQAQVARNNQVVAAQNAQAAQNQAAEKVQVAQRAGDMRLSAQRAAMGAGGVALDSGSALDVTGSTAEQTALGAGNAGYEGQLAAYGYRAQGTNFGAQAQLADLSGQNAQAASYTNAASSFLGGASQVASKWKAWQTPGYGGGYG